MHYFKRNIGDYHKKAGRLSMLQHGAYTLLLDACYDREQFPTMEDALDWVWASSDAEIEAVKFVLNKFFVNESGSFIQYRIQDELERYHKNASTNQRIALEREAKRKEKRTKRAPSVNEAPPNQEPLTINQEPITNINTPAINRFDEFWDLYGKKVDTKKCKAKFDKLSGSSIEKIFEVLPDYIASTPDKQFRKLPATWLNGECWNDEIQKTMMIETCGIDYDLLVNDFNNAMANHAGVPEAIKITESQKQKLSPIANEYKMTNERFKGYFNHCANSDKFSYVINGVGMPAQGINYFLKEETLLKGME